LFLEQKRWKYVVTFDVIRFEFCQNEIYKDTWEKTFESFLQCEIDFNDGNTGSKHDMMRMHYVYKNWLLNLKNGMATYKYSAYYSPTTTLNFKTETKVRLIRINLILIIFI